MTTCIACGSKEFNRGLVKKTCPAHGLTFSADVPAETCVKCGEVYFDSRDLVKLEEDSDRWAVGVHAANEDLDIDLFAMSASAMVYNRAWTTLLRFGQEVDRVYDFRECRLYLTAEKVGRWAKHGECDPAAMSQLTMGVLMELWGSSMGSEKDAIESLIASPPSNLRSVLMAAMQRMGEWVAK